MKDSTKKIVLIILIVLAMLGSLLSFAISMLIGSYEFSDEDIQQVSEFYGDVISTEEIQERLSNGSGILIKIAIINLIIQVIMLISAINGPNKNRVALIYLSIMNLLFSLSPILLAVLIISCIKSKDVPYKGIELPEVEEKHTFKMPVYIISFLAIWILVYNEVMTKILPGLVDWAKNNVILFEVLFFLSLFLIVVILLRKEIVRDFKLLIHNFGSYFNLTVKDLFWIMLLNIGTGLILRFVTKEQADNQEALNLMPLWFMIVFGTIIGPMVEEGIYRGILRKFIKNKVAFVITSTLLFGAIHVVTFVELPESPAQYWFLIQYCTMGIVLSMNYVKTKNIFSSYLVHMLMNGTATALTALILL